MPGQVDQDDLALFGELVEHRVPGLAAVRHPVHQHERLAGPVSLTREHLRLLGGPAVPGWAAADRATSTGHPNATYL